jgi:tetratricopeptide (TPR) repeat protein
LEATELVGHEILAVVDQLIIDGRIAEQLGDLARAEGCYREVLQLAPRHVKALCGLGIVARKTHHSELAIRCFRRALAVAEPAADNHLHLADALLDAGRLDEAVSGYQRALDLDPSHLGAQLQIGRVLRQAGRNEEAAAHLRNVVAFDPQNHDALIELGRALAASCLIDEAIDCFRQALRLDSDSIGALEAMGLAYLEDHCYADAEESFRKAIGAAPGRAESYFQLAKSLEAQGRMADAATALEQAAALDPRAEGPLLRLALVRREQGNLAAAAELLRRAVALKPNDANLLNSFGVVEREQGHTAEALRSFDRALQLRPDHAEAHFNHGLVLLQAGRLAAGWLEFEWRGRNGQSAGQNAFGLPRWTGDSLAGRTILIHGEQSPADEVMFASCYEEVMAQAAGCLLLCDPRLERLFRRSFPTARVYPLVRGGEGQWQLPAGVRCNVQIPAGSLPLYLRTSASSFPKPHHFLVADAARVALWKQRYATTGEGLKVGLAWHDGGNSLLGRAAVNGKTKQHVIGQQLGIDLAQWRSLVEWSGAIANRVQWINLQDGAAAKAERIALEGELDIAIHDWPAAQGQYDLDDMAARIAALDLVISADSLPTHLAGSLGAPAWAVVRQADGWRWLAQGDATLWYPSVRLLSAAESAASESAAAEGAATQADGSTGLNNPMERLREELLKRWDSPAEEQPMRSVAPPHWRQRPAEPKPTVGQ